MVGRTSVSKIKALKKKKDPVDDLDSYANEEWITFLRMGGFNPDTI